MHLIDPDTAFYDEQVEFVLDAYERNIKEALINCPIGSITPVAINTYTVSVQQSFNIFYGNEGRETMKNFNNTYTVQRDQYDVFLINDLEVSEIAK